ncbi:hypothetical protein NC796_06495 [Aliifodinibius sp. S!AR15-10]|uniref:hypothetical protein n=1 Tax=Aliifodinibius sp. S!AR15-10 TaxID=2950437 RepID=UPI00285BF41F|nr:hypothetical protein [Aliifodinibius sp. S!AR15-10]MDR8390777.1 hypothetical protein [Aliifodinibius sp. S!AR15-10]
MSLLIADSGSTKTDWALISNHSVKQYKTEGLNPYFHSSKSIEKVLKNDLKPDLEGKNVNHILFYGSGCDSEPKITSMTNILKRVFPGAEASVHEDLLGAARACCFDKPGIVCILGTGSNSCRYDGTRIVQQIPSLGFILGDEGSAGYFGQKLINHYYRNEIPSDLARKLEWYYDMDLDSIFDGIYNNDQSSRFVAFYSSFLGEHNDHHFIREMLCNGFENFISRIVLQYQDARSYKVNFIGSLGCAYQAILKELLTKHLLTPGVFIKSPMDRLVEFHNQ